MTVAEGIAMVRLLLDEPKYEYFGESTNLDGEFRDALRQAAAQYAKQAYDRGEKEAVRPIWRRETGAMNGSGVVTLTLPFLVVEEVASNWSVNTLAVAPFTTFYYVHRYASPQEFYRRQLRSPWDAQAPTVGVATGQTFFGRLEYTIDNSTIVVNRQPGNIYANSDVIVTYLSVPVISATGTDQLPLARYTHGIICDIAAQIMYRKEHPGDDRQALGSIVDIESALSAGATQGGTV